MYYGAVGNPSSTLKCFKYKLEDITECRWGLLGLVKPTPHHQAAHEVVLQVGGGRKAEVRHVRGHLEAVISDQCSQ